MAKIQLRGTKTDLYNLKKRFAMMTGNGDDTVSYDPNDPQSLRDTIKKICEELKSGKLLWGANKGNTKRYKIADKNDLEAISELENKLKEDAYEKLMLANDLGDKVVLGAIPRGG